MREAANLKEKRKRIGKKWIDFELPKVGESFEINGDEFFVASAEESEKKIFKMIFVNPEISIEVNITKNAL